MNWDDIKIFLAIAKKGGLKKAAKNLGIHHSSCARRINKLEKDLGIKLFDRLPSGYELTHGGEELLQSAQTIDSGFNTIERDILGKDLRIEGDLCLTVSNGLVCHLLMPDIHQFMALYPDINLKIVMSYEVRDLANREADVAIRHVDNPPDSLTGKRVARIYSSAYASKHYLATHQLDTQPTSCDWLGWGESKNHLRWPGKSHYPDIPVKGNMYSDVLQLAGIKANMGIASLPCYIGDHDPDITRIPGVEAEAREYIWILAHKDMARNARVRTLIDFLAKAFIKHKNTMEGILQ